MAICEKCGKDHEAERKEMVEKNGGRPLSYKQEMERFVNELAEEMGKVEGRATIELAVAKRMGYIEFVESVLGKTAVEEGIEMYEWLGGGECKLPFNVFAQVLNSTPEEIRAMKADLLLQELCRIELLKRGDKLEDEKKKIPAQGRVLLPDIEQFKDGEAGIE